MWDSRRGSTLTPTPSPFIEGILDKGFTPDNTPATHWGDSGRSSVLTTPPTPSLCGFWVGLYS